MQIPSVSYYGSKVTLPDIPIARVNLRGFYYLECLEIQKHHSMKKQSTFIIVAILILSAGILAFKSNDNQEAPSIVIVRALIVPNGNLSKIQIYRGDARAEEIKLANLRADSQDLNWQTITRTLSNLRGEGYHVVSCSVNGETTVNSTYVFSK